MILFRQFHQLHALLRHQFLVGSRYALTRFQCSGYEGKCRLHASHRLYDDLYFRIFHDCVHIMYENLLHRLSGELSQVQNILYVQFFAAQILPDYVSIRVHYIVNTGSNGAEAHDCHLNHITLSFVLFLCPIPVFYSCVLFLCSMHPAPVCPGSAISGSH